MSYIGRFAPSPTGPLHLGSLLAAVASFLHARRSNGRWLVRIEDVDPPREVPGAADEILKTLEAFALHWDVPVVRQSTRIGRYRAAADELLARGAAFRCSCSRKTLRAGGDASELGALYPGTCRDRTVHDGPTALRIRVEPGELAFDDELRGRVGHDVSVLTGDYVIYRKDGLPAYHLAVVLDDAEQGITHVVRGSDLLAATCVHLHLQRVLGIEPPRYCHIPLLKDASGQKLSKQQGAEPVDAARAGAVASRVLGLLGLTLPAPISGAPPAEQWAWAVKQWQPTAIPASPELP